MLPDKRNNRVLAGTYGNGLLIFDTLQQLVKHIKTLPGESQRFSSNAIIKNTRGDYLLFACGSRYVWVLSYDLSTLTPIKISSYLPDKNTGVGYFGNFLFQNEREALAQSQSRVYRASFTRNTAEEYQFAHPSAMTGVFYNASVVTHTNDELVFLMQLTGRN
ncbi:MAG: hypothetical protein WKI04_19565 [Ferruginibacter sp.]